jgi:hypothetical protein
MIMAARLAVGWVTAEDLAAETAEAAEDGEADDTATGETERSLANARILPAP